MEFSGVSNLRPLMLVLVCAFIMIATALSLMAQALRNPNECVAVGDGSISNSCNATINVTYCVDNDRHPYKCSGDAWALVSIKPGGADRIPEYKSNGGGAVRYAACVSPQSPLNWSPQSNTYSCR